MNREDEPRDPTEPVTSDDARDTTDLGEATDLGETTGVGENALLGDTGDTGETGETGESGETTAVGEGTSPNGITAVVGPPEWLESDTAAQPESHETTEVAGPPVPLPAAGNPSPSTTPTPEAREMFPRSSIGTPRAVPPVEPTTSTSPYGAASSSRNPFEQTPADIGTAETTDLGTNLTVPYPSVSPAAASDSPPSATPYSAPGAFSPPAPPTAPNPAGTPLPYVAQNSASAPRPYGTPNGNPYASAGTSPAQGLSLASMILGIVGVFLSWVFVGFLAALAAVIMGHLAQRRQPQAKPYWLTGIITGYVGIAITLLMVLLVVVPLIFLFALGSSYSSGY